MPDSRITLPDEAATQALAASLAARARPGDVLLLSGPLGAGKTSFSRAFIRACAADQNIEVGPIAHYDLWRLTSHRALEELGWDEALSGIVLVEWPDRLGPLIPADALQLTISLIPEGREIIISGGKRWFDAS
jgi:tRNA threonylcarbamoyladenosine biosynthesis protein TsaE